MLPGGGPTSALSAAAREAHRGAPGCRKARPAQPPRVGPALKRVPPGGARPQRATHHHAQLGLELLIHRPIQHQVHELVEAAQHAAHVPVGVQLDCGAGGRRRSGGEGAVVQGARQQQRRRPEGEHPAASTQLGRAPLSFLSIMPFSSGGLIFGCRAGKRGGPSGGSEQAAAAGRQAAASTLNAAEGIGGAHRAALGSAGLSDANTGSIGAFQAAAAGRPLQASAQGPAWLTIVP